MANEVLTLRIPSEMKKNLERLGKSLSRSKSYIAEKAISEYLERNAWQTSELKKAEKEVERGVFISGEKMEAYLSSWGTANELSVPKPDIS